MVDQYEAFVVETFPPEEASAKLATINWNRWLYQPGMPPAELNNFTTKSGNLAIELADEFIALEGLSLPKEWESYNSWMSALKQMFLDRLNLKKDEVTRAILAKIDKAYGLTAALDPEVKSRWYPFSMKIGYEGSCAETASCGEGAAPGTCIINEAHLFASSVGRGKYIRPIYQALMDTGNEELAAAWLAENENFYHPITLIPLQRIVALE